MCQHCGDFPTNGIIFISRRGAHGAGIVCTEVVHTLPEGRISPGCLGIWSDDHRDALARLAETISSHGAVRVAQIGHAGRKAAVSPWEGSLPIRTGRMLGLR